MIWQSLPSSSNQFVLFSPEHLYALAAAATTNLVVIIYFLRGEASASIRRSTRYTLAVILLGSELSWQWWQVTDEVWHLRYSLPLHLCDVALLLSVVMLIWRIQALFELVYFWAFAGTLQALITPDLGNYNFPHMHFFQYFISHSMVILAVAYMIVAEGFRPHWRSIWKVFWVTNIYAGGVALINVVAKSNYLMLSAKPMVPTIVDYLGPWPAYILALEAIGLLSCVLYYIPFAIKDRQSKSVREHS